MYARNLCNKKILRQPLSELLFLQMVKDNFTDLFPPSALDGVLPSQHGQPSATAERSSTDIAETAPAAELISQQRHVYTVSELLSEIRDILDIEFGPVWTRGEISGFSRAASGHCYFTLREGKHCLKCVMFRNTASDIGFTLKDGLNVNCRGRLNIYTGRGDLQLVVEGMEQAGRGLLFARLEELRKKLEKEGLFADELKKALPTFPERIFLVTSPAGAAVRDFIRTARARWGGADITVVPTPVQGADAVPEIVRAIRIADRTAGARDVIVVTRGGGSLEDLWAFNEEEVVRAVAACRAPVVSAVGHETDFTITDLAADLRAATPTAAGTLVAPDAMELRHRVSTLLHRAARATNHVVTDAGHRVQVLRHRLKDPGTRLVEQRQRIDETLLRMRHAVLDVITRSRERLSVPAGRLRLHSPEKQIDTLNATVGILENRLKTGMQNRLSAHRAAMERTVARLETVSPLSVLSRGYSLVIAEKDNRIVRNAEEVKEGDKLRIRPHSGEILCEVTGTHTDHIYGKGKT